MLTAIERRAVGLPIELRSEGDGTITGMAAVFNVETVIGGALGWREKIAPGAFDRALSNPDDVRALFNHDPNVLLGRTVSDTLRLSKTTRGLKYEIDLPDTAAARDVRELIKRGDVSGSSLGFRVLDDDWDESDVKQGKLPLRTITDVELLDISAVTFPAYTTTSVTAKDGTAHARHTAVVARVNQAKLEAEVDVPRAWREDVPPAIIGTLESVACQIGEVAAVPGARFERFLPSAFRASLSRGGQTLRLDHKRHIVGRFDEITECWYGAGRGELRFAFSVFDGPVGREVLQGVRVGEIVTCSLGFNIRQSHYTTTAVGFTVHDFREVDLVEISLLSQQATPALMGTFVTESGPDAALSARVAKARAA